MVPKRIWTILYSIRMVDLDPFVGSVPTSVRKEAGAVRAEERDDSIENR